MQDELAKKLNEAIDALNIQDEKIIGLTIVNQLLAELLFASSPNFKELAADVIPQILDRPDSPQNKYAAKILEEILKAAQNPTRLTPEGRRGWLRPVSNPHQD